MRIHPFRTEPRENNHYATLKSRQKHTHEKKEKNGVLHFGDEFFCLRLQNYRLLIWKRFNTLNSGQNSNGKKVAIEEDPDFRLSFLYQFYRWSASMDLLQLE